MMHINVTIEGISPLLMNQFHETAQQKVSSGVSSTGIGSKGTPREQAEPKAYRDHKGQLFIPGPNVFAALIEAGKFHKNGKSKVTTQRTSIVPAGIAVLEIAIPLGTREFEVDSRSVVIPATGGRVMCHRPRLDKWKAVFTLEVDTDLFSAEFVRMLVDDAGKKIGLGDFRPARKGPFGRFVVSNWKILKEPKTRLAATL
jgi:hypothetical protein